MDHLLPLRVLKSNWPRDGRAGTRPPKLTTNALITLDAHGVAHAAADAQRSETFFGVAHFGCAHQHNRSALNALANGAKAQNCRLHLWCRGARV